MKKIFVACSAYILFLLLNVSPAQALTIKNDDSYYLPKTETIDGTLLVAGHDITVDGTVNGDIICGGQNVTINGDVNGDVVCGAQTLRINGKVSGSVRSVGQTIEINGQVIRNITSAGQIINLGGGSRVDGEIILAGQAIGLNGSVNKDTMLFAESVSVDGNLNGNLELTAAEIYVGGKTEVKGNFVYTSDNSANIIQGATISGQTTHRLPPVNRDNGVSRRNPVSNYGTPLKIASILSYLVFGLFLVWLFSTRIIKILQLMEKNPKKSMLWGLAAVFLTPVAILVLAITIVGIPLAILTGIVYGITLAFSRLFLAILVGRKILGKISPPKSTSLPLSVVIGVPLLWLGFAVPVAGSLLSCLAVILGTGALIYSFCAAK